MNILAVGDIVGTIGVKELQKKLQKVKQKYNVDFTIVNGENAAEGMGITEKNFKDILQAGADCVTMGNHTWGKKEIFKFIDDPKIIRPANYPKSVCGKGYNIYNVNGKIIFGELTFFPASGYKKFSDDKFDYILGEKFVLPKRNIK